MAAARRLHEAMEQARATGTRVRMRSPFEGTVSEEEPLFYAEPRPPLPAKGAG
jgi:hypothetical protein